MLDYPRPVPRTPVREPAPKPFQSLIRKPKFRLTTIIAIEAKDAVVMGADSQQTGWAKEVTNKIEWMPSNALVGFAGSSEYIEILSGKVMDALMKREQAKRGRRRGYQNALNSAIDEYSKYAAERIETLKLRNLPNFDIRDYYPEGLVAAFKSRRDDPKVGYPSIYQFKTPHPCLNVLPRFRAAVGSGGDVATVFLKTVEDYIEPFDLSWRDFSSDVISLFVGVLLQRIARIDPYSSGVDVWKLKADTTETVPLRFDPNTDHLSILLSGMISELSPDKLSEIMKRSRLRDVLRELGFG